VEPEDPAALITEASCLVELNRLDEAERVAREAVSIAPTLSTSHMLLALALHGLKRNEEALAAIGQARRLDPTEPRIALKQAQMSLLMNRREDARRYFEELVQLEPSSLPGHLSLARLYANQGQWGLANKSIQRARALAPDDVRVAELARTIARNLREPSRRPTRQSS
jgi:tetratricopeptide (TPR) repeat protein